MLSIAVRVMMMQKKRFVCMDGSAGGRTLKQNENRNPVHSGVINFRKMGAVTRRTRGPDGTEIEKQLRIPVDVRNS